MADHEMELYLVVFDEKSFNLSSELYGDIDEYINDNYVEEKTAEEYLGRYEDIDTAGSADNTSLFISESRKRSELRLPRKISKGKARKKEEIFDGMSKPQVEPFEEESVLKICAPSVKSLDDVVKNLDKTFMELVFSFADDRGMTDVEVQKRANLDRKAFSKLKCGTTKNPSKSTALALAVALKLNLDDTKDLLSRAGFALSPCSKQDLIVQYFIEREAYDINAINIALFEHGEQILGMQTV